jgi:hypothetical protein
MEAIASTSNTPSFPTSIQYDEIRTRVEERLCQVGKIVDRLKVAGSALRRPEADFKQHQQYAYEDVNILNNYSNMVSDSARELEQLWNEILHAMPEVNLRTGQQL